MAGYSDYIFNIAAKVISNAVPINEFNVITNRFLTISMMNLKRRVFMCMIQPQVI